MNAPMPSAGRQLGAVGERHLLRRVVGGEAVPGLALEAGAALAAHGAPVEDDEVAGRHVGDALADRLDRAGGLVAEQEREVVVDAALAVVQVGVADPAGLDRTTASPGPGSGTTTSTSSTSAPLARAMTPLTVWGTGPPRSAGMVRGRSAGPARRGGAAATLARRAGAGRPLSTSTGRIGCRTARERLSARKGVVCSDPCPYPVFDDVIHEPHRLRICAMLVPSTGTDFATVRDEMGLSDSALSKHLKTLSERGYTRLERTVRDGHQVTTVVLTARPAARPCAGTWPSCQPDGADRRQRPTRRPALAARPGRRGGRRDSFDLSVGRTRATTRAVAIAATPSPRPVRPSPSVVVPLTDTGAPTASESAACASARRLPTLGRLPTTCTATLPISTAGRAHQPGRLGEQGAPRGARPARAGRCRSARRGRRCRRRRSSASQAAWAATSASECPSSPALARPVQPGDPAAPVGRPRRRGRARRPRCRPWAVRSWSAAAAGRGPARPASTRSASSRSSGVVTLKASGSPVDDDHVVAAELDQRGVVGGRQTAAVGRDEHLAREALGRLHGAQRRPVGGAGDDARAASTVLTVSTSGSPGTAPAAPPRTASTTRSNDRQRGQAAGGVVDEHDVDVAARARPARRPPSRCASAPPATTTASGGRSTPAQRAADVRVGELGRGDDDERAPARGSRATVSTACPSSGRPRRAHERLGQARARAGCPTRPRRRRRRRCTGQRRRRSRQCGLGPCVRTRGPRRG